MSLVVYFTFILFSIVSACDECVLSKAAIYTKPTSLSSGTCGYGSLALKLNGGHVAAGVPSLYKDGAGCGACYQIRCKDSDMCSKRGIKVVLTDINKNNKTDFLLSSRALKAMALPGKDIHALKIGALDVEYKRVPCDYKGRNLAIRIEESSKNPDYLVIQILFQGGQTEIVAVDVAKVGSSNWTFMTRKYGAIWETKKAPSNGPLQFKFVVTSGFEGKNIWAKNVVPANWKPGVIYDTKVQINDIALQGCTPCADTQWNSPCFLGL
ncbi:expansin-like A2 [Silene latifolia]|uniref:expansin-like A2 n=1 Tax=Silene latifolia TaxID=37657 RepID=UPI003D784247